MTSLSIKFKNQICRVYAIRALLNALAPLIGAEEESEGKAVSAGWAESVDSDKLASWTKKGLELATELDRTTQETTAVEYGYLIRKVRRNEVSQFGKKKRKLEHLKLVYSVSVFVVRIQPMNLNYLNHSLD